MNFDVNTFVKIRHDLHKNPELGFCEDNTKKKIVKFLTKLALKFIKVLVL